MGLVLPPQAMGVLVEVVRIAPLLVVLETHHLHLHRKVTTALMEKVVVVKEVVVEAVLLPLVLLAQAVLQGALELQTVLLELQ
jgi:hypothetical protein